MQYQNYHKLVGGGGGVTYTISQQNCMRHLHYRQLFSFSDPPGFSHNSPPPPPPKTDASVIQRQAKCKLPLCVLEGCARFDLRKVSLFLNYLI